MDYLMILIQCYYIVSAYSVCMLSKKRLRPLNLHFIIFYFFKLELFMKKVTKNLTKYIDKHLSLLSYYYHLRKWLCELTMVIFFTFEVWMCWKLYIEVELSRVVNVYSCLIISQCYNTVHCKHYKCFNFRRKPLLNTDFFSLIQRCVV